ncbi:MAG: hypothetical protein ABEJ79_00520 [Halolamina sp.]
MSSSSRSRPFPPRSPLAAVTGVARRASTAAVAALGLVLATAPVGAHEGHETTTSASAVGGSTPSLLLVGVGAALMVGWGAAYARDAVSDRLAAAGVLAGVVVLLVAAVS